MKTMNILLRGTKSAACRSQTVTLPIPEDEYTDVIHRLEASGMGGVTAQDCRIQTVSSGYPILKRMEDTAVNIDELDYLARWLESASSAHITAFQAIACKQATWRIQDFINLTVCCHKATVITDFSDWESIGRTHYKTHCPDADERELAHVNFRSEALTLILNTAGTVTPYGVLYENGMEMSRSYNGGAFPECNSPETVLCLMVSRRDMPVGGFTCLNLPMCGLRLERALERTGIRKDSPVHIAVRNISAPPYTLSLDFDRTPLEEWNELCRSISRLDDMGREKLNAVMEYVKPKTAPEMTALTENLDCFHTMSTGDTAGFPAVSYHGRISLEELMGRESANK